VEDEKIIQLFFQRNEQAVVETDRTYGRKLYVLSNNILNNREDAEESVSDTYMEAWKTIPPKHPTCFYAFLAAICRNLSFNRLDWRIVRLKKTPDGWWRTSSTDHYADFDTQITEEEAMEILNTYHKPVKLDTKPISEFEEP